MYTIYEGKQCFANQVEVIVVLLSYRALNDGLSLIEHPGKNTKLCSQHAYLFLLFGKK